MLWVCGEPGSGPGQTSGGPGSPGVAAAHPLRTVPGRQRKEAGPGLRRGRGRGRDESLLGSGSWRLGRWGQGFRCGAKEGFSEYCGR